MKGFTMFQIIHPFLEHFKEDVQNLSWNIAGLEFIVCEFLQLKIKNTSVPLK